MNVDVGDLVMIQNFFGWSGMIGIVLVTERKVGDADLWLYHVLCPSGMIYFSGKDLVRI